MGRKSHCNEKEWVIPLMIQILSEHTGCRNLHQFPNIAFLHNFKHVLST